MPPAGLLTENISVNIIPITYRVFCNCNNLEEEATHEKMWEWK
jgi:hypothetical protein